MKNTNTGWPRFSSIHCRAALITSAASRRTRAE
jgi:hypothetical protein